MPSGPNFSLLSSYESSDVSSSLSSSSAGGGGAEGRLVAARAELVLNSSLVSFAVVLGAPDKGGKPAKEEPEEALAELEKREEPLWKEKAGLAASTVLVEDPELPAVNAAPGPTLKPAPVEEAAEELGAGDVEVKGAE